MMNKRSNLVERRLYEYTLHAVTSPLYTIESNRTSDQLATHVAKLFNVDPEEHEQKYMQAIKKEPCSVVLLVDVKQARDLRGEDQNGLSDPYCEITVVNIPSHHENSNGLATSSLSILSSEMPSIRKRSLSLFSCVRSSSPKDHLKPPSRKVSRRNSKSSKSSSGTHSSNQLILESLNENRTSSVPLYRTKVKQKTLKPEWNEHVEFDIDNILDKYLRICVYDSDSERVPGLIAAVQEKRGFLQKFSGIHSFLKTGEIKDDFLGEILLDVKSLAVSDRDQWFRLEGSNQNRSNGNNSSGEILLGLKVHFKLDERNTKVRQRVSSGAALEFRRGHSTVSGIPITSSIIFRSSIFRKNFRRRNLHINDTANKALTDDFAANFSRCDSCLTPATDTDSPLLIEEYHQLTRIIMLHELEDVRQTIENPSSEIVIDWNGSLSPLSVDVLIQFRVLYNISILSHALIQLLVIMELRCSSDYAMFISQGVLVGFLKPFLHQLDLRDDGSDLDFTDYEKTAFNDILYAFVGHYNKRVNKDTPWFLPSTEAIPNIQSIFELINTLLVLKICSSQPTIRIHFEEIIKSRLQTDINDCFSVYTHAFDDKNDMQLAAAKHYLEYVTKIAKSMSMLSVYQGFFAPFNINYVKECFFGTQGVGDRLTEITICLLGNRTEYFEAHSKPTVTATSSIFDPNLIDSSRTLLNLYLYLKTIVETLPENLQTRDWEINAFKLKLIEYHKWFSPTMKFLLEGFVAFIRQVMERAVENDNELEPSSSESTLHSESATVATNLCIRLCREWESIDYPNTDVRYTALIKLTNTICEQCQHYARRIARKLSDNSYFPDLERTQSFNVSKKLCTLVNDIEYVKSNLLSSLPNLLNFSSVIDKMNEEYESTDFQRTKVTLERLIATAENEMNDVMKLIFEHVATSFYESLRGKIRDYYEAETRNKANCMTDIHQYIDQQILQQLHEGLEIVQYSRVASAIRIKALQCFKELLPFNVPPDFYKRVLTSFDLLANYFEEVCREKSHTRGPPCDEEKAFRSILEKCALSTEQLQLMYFLHITLARSPHEYSVNHGQIAFRAAYETINDLLTIHVFILNCRHLTKMDYFGKSDPYVVLELMPSTVFQSRAKSFQTTTKKQTLNPDFNELFHWHRLPRNVLSIPGTVLHMSVWDLDVMTDDFIGECFVPLANIESLANRQSIRDVPASEIPLRRPLKNIQPSVFELIRSRIRFDPIAAQFVKDRTRVMETGTGNDDRSISSDDRHSSGSYASSVIRSMVSMLPFNMSFGFNSNSRDRSDVDDNDDDNDII
ncbi:unnamed protein product [Rotaria magnacalcarata]|uniref:Uncharacterized protein n=1 Tax=Rotaria magnacalcarata TaxID=392030 RepID=A0A815V3R8_9BILA|nr:unnamed protein product [Rotaria magnacalcarata]